MPHSTAQKINSSLTLGEILEQARLRKAVTVEEAALIANVQKKYLICLEKGEYNRLPGDIYGKNFLKAYCRFLKLKYPDLLLLYQKETAMRQKTFPKNSSCANIAAPYPQFKINRCLLTPKIIRSGLIAVMIFAFLGYLGWQIKEIIGPPQLTIYKPNNNLITTSKAVEIIGQTEKEVTVTINKIKIPGTPNGYFKHEIFLQEGMNSVEISAQKKHSRPRVIYRNILMEKMKEKTALK